MRCLTIDGNGVLLDVVPQPADMSSCALVVQSAAEVGMGNPFNLSAADGAAYAWAVVFVWSIGFAWRAVIRALQTHSEENQNA